MLSPRLWGCSGFLVGSFILACRDVLLSYPILYEFSASVIHQLSDWRNTYVMGYWFLDDALDWISSEALLIFLQGGSPPVFIGFGSMGSRNPEETADLVLNTIAPILLSLPNSLQP